MEWKKWTAGLALLLASVSGCKQQCFLTHEDYKLYQDQMVVNLANDPHVVAKPLNEASRAPMTVNDTVREIRYMSLAEAIAIALEQGTVGNQSIDAAGLPSLVGGIGTSSDNPARFGGVGAGGRVGGSDAIRALRIDPALAGLNLEASLTKFDAIWQTSMNWQNTDRPIGTALDSFQGQQNNAIEQMDAAFQTSLIKPLPSGGVAGITFNTGYTLTNLPARVNPSYRPSLQFQFEQPLLQGFGVEINQLRAGHPGATSIQGLQNLSPTNEGILISRIRFDQQRAEFERQVQVMVSNVEIAYWNLYYAYWNLYATEALLRARYETLRITETRFVAGLAESTAQDVQLARGQYEDSRSQRLQAINSILDAERSLRGMLQMRMDDGYRLVPTDEPTLAPYIPNWEQGFNEAMTLRPELYQSRQEVKALQLALVELKNQLMPDLRFFANYDINSVGNRLDGPTSENAFRELAGNHFNNWTLGLRLNVPIGFRLANANVRRAELALARAYETLKDSEAKVERNLGLQYQRIITNYELIRTTRAARLAYGEQVKTRLALLQAGKSGTLLNVVLDAQRQWADSLSQEYRFIRDYNLSLVGWEYAKGTTLVRNNIQIAEGPLPSFAQIRAAEHEREKAAALKLREHPLAPCSLTDPMSSKLGVTVPPLGTPLPEIMHSMPLLKDAPPVGALPGVQPQPVLGQPVLGQPVPGQVIPGQVIPGQPVPGQLAPQQPGQPLESLPAPSTFPSDLPPVGSRNPPPTGGSSRPKRDPNAPTEFGTAGRGEEVSQPQPLPQQP